MASARACRRTSPSVRGLSTRCSPRSLAHGAALHRARVCVDSALQGGHAGQGRGARQGERRGRHQDAVRPFALLQGINLFALFPRTGDASAHLVARKSFATRAAPPRPSQHVSPLRPPHLSKLACLATGLVAPLCVRAVRGAGSHADTRRCAGCPARAENACSHARMPRPPHDVVPCSSACCARRDEVLRRCRGGDVRGVRRSERGGTARPGQHLRRICVQVVACHRVDAASGACLAQKRRAADIGGWLSRVASGQVARDIDNLREGGARSAAPYSEKVLYSDGLAARWSGREHFSTHAPVGALLTKARAVVSSMRMDGLDAAYIGWSLSGQSAVGTVNLVSAPLASCASGQWLSSGLPRARLVRRG